MREGRLPMEADGAWSMISASDALPTAQGFDDTQAGEPDARGVEAGGLAKALPGRPP
jgi:hypothetical protein